MPFAWTVIRVAAIAILVLPPVASAQDSADELAEEAVRANPEIEQLQAQRRAIQQRAHAARVWKDPVFSVEYSNFPWDSWALGDSPMTGVQFRVLQSLPFPGKNERRQETVRARADLVDIERRELENHLRAAVRSAYYELALVRQLEELTGEHIEAVDELRARVRMLYEVGRGSQKDVMQLDLLSATLQDRLEDFGRNAAELKAVINATLHRDLETKIPTPDVLPLVEPDVTVAHLLERAKSERPALLARQKQSEIHRLAAKQESYERWPDISVWFGYRIRAEAGMDDGVDQLSIGASIPIPLDYAGRTRALSQEQSELSEATILSKEALADDIAQGIARQLARWRRAASKAENHRVILVPKARDAFSAALLAYETDRADFWAVYRAELELIDLERALRTATAEALISWVAIERLVGGELERGDLEIDPPSGRGKETKPRLDEVQP